MTLPGDGTMTAPCGEINVRFLLASLILSSQYGDKGKSAGGESY
jgi:hypothetical protein